MSKEAIEKIQELYCKWCPKDCQNLTKAEKLGCLASAGFADELKSLGYVQLDPDQGLPDINTLNIKPSDIPLWVAAHDAGQRDMLNAGFKKMK